MQERQTARAGNRIFNGRVLNYPVACSSRPKFSRSAVFFFTVSHYARAADDKLGHCVVYRFENGPIAGNDGSTLSNEDSPRLVAGIVRKIFERQSVWAALGERTCCLTRPIQNEQKSQLSRATRLLGKRSSVMSYKRKRTRYL